MYKIVAAVNSMISNQHLIEEVVRKDGELFFLYNKKFIWSIIKLDDGGYSLFYYPNDESMDSLKSRTNWRDADYIVYATDEIKTKESIESFSELYQTVKSKLFNIDSVLDQIINTAA